MFETAQNLDVRPRLASDPPGRVREPVPRYDALRRWWSKHQLARGVRPIAGALVIGGAALAISVELGVAELAFGGLAAYATYRMLRYGIDLKQALTETIELERVVPDILK